jgi:hypothetical protein
MKKIIIAGTRTFSNYKLLESTLDEFLKTYEGEEIVIISGCADGADSLGEKYARKRKLEVIKMPADWKNLGKAAGMIRNEDMAKIGDILIAFWDQKSTGTEGMIDLAYKYKLEEVRVINYE